MSLQTPVYISNSVYSALYQLPSECFPDDWNSPVTLLSVLENQRPDYGSLYAKFEILSTIHITLNKSGYV